MTTELLWDAYAATRIDCDIDGRRAGLTGPAAERLPGRPPVFVITAYNPASARRDDVRNEMSQRDLEGDLATLGVTTWPAWGTVRDGTWCERSVAIVGLDREKACALGRRYLQLAVFELTDDEVRVVRCSDSTIMQSAARRL